MILRTSGKRRHSRFYKPGEGSTTRGYPPRCCSLHFRAGAPSPGTRISLICPGNAEGRPEEALSAPKCCSNERKLLFTRRNARFLRDSEPLAGERLRGNNRIFPLTSMTARDEIASRDTRFIRLLALPHFRAVSDPAVRFLSQLPRRGEVRARVQSVAA